METQKLEFKDKAKPRVGSKDKAAHVPGGGQKKVGDVTNNHTPTELSLLLFSSIQLARNEKILHQLREDRLCDCLTWFACVCLNDV